ncbi:monopolin complex subunit csm1 [Anaeramoeba flamelloides]|uniref:Monopolin complex subunit csm1 n=1 Tax=Anaeramoeba flamelloides TaxID=1746091 RepID=A0AAV8AAU8_9EUKA|nr:monopolin complex subunit csm1 [Anaeramoeba flamelloides]
MTHQLRERRTISYTNYYENLGLNLESDPFLSQSKPLLKINQKRKRKKTKKKNKKKIIKTKFSNGRKRDLENSMNQLKNDENYHNLENVPLQTGTQKPSTLLNSSKKKLKKRIVLTRRDPNILKPNFEHQNTKHKKETQTNEIRIDSESESELESELSQKSQESNYDPDQDHGIYLDNYKKIDQDIDTDNENQSGNYNGNDTDSIMDSDFEEAQLKKNKNNNYKSIVTSDEDYLFQNKQQQQQEENSNGGQQLNMDKILSESAHFKSDDQINYKEKYEELKENYLELQQIRTTEAEQMLEQFREVMGNRSRIAKELINKLENENKELIKQIENEEFDKRLKQLQEKHKKELKELKANLENEKQEISKKQETQYQKNIKELNNQKKVLELEKKKLLEKNLRLEEEKKIKNSQKIQKENTNNSETLTAQDDYQKLMGKLKQYKNKLSNSVNLSSKLENQNKKLIQKITFLEKEIKIVNKENQNQNQNQNDNTNHDIFENQSNYNDQVTFEALEQQIRVNSFLELFSGMSVKELEDNVYECSCKNSTNSKQLSFKIKLPDSIESKEIEYHPIKINIENQPETNKIPDFFKEEISFERMFAPIFLVQLINTIIKK